MKKKSKVDRQAKPDITTLMQKCAVDLDPETLVLALTHRSFAHEAGGLPTNERLEFLGDSILGLIVTEKLYRTYPDFPEGKLAKMRAATVSQTALASVARKIQLGEYILLGRGEILTNGKDKDSILSDAMEALIGAIYLCHGLETTRSVVEQLLGELLQDVVERGAEMDWKTTLQELASVHGKPVPVYSVTGHGPDHNRIYYAEVSIPDFVVGTGRGSSKKIAEQNAAQMATEIITSNFGN